MLLRLSSLFTPRWAMLVARCAVVVLITIIGLAYSNGGVSLPVTATLAYSLTIALLVSFPAIRSADLASSAAILMSSVEFFDALSNHIDLARWFVGMAAIGGAIGPLRAQHIRSLALVNPYRSFARSDRRRRRRWTPAEAAVLRPEPVADIGEMRRVLPSTEARR